MSNARQAMEWLLQGKKIRQVNWNSGDFIYYDIGAECFRYDSGNGAGTLSLVATYELYQEPKKLKGPYWRWEYLADDKTIFSDCYYDEKFINPLNFTAKYLTESKWKRKIGDPIWFNEDGTPVNIDGNILT
jgi:hypothetical protein